LRSFQRLIRSAKSFITCETVRAAVIVTEYEM